mmetsp:Transcript_1006/g.1073  ORF Transcript_1006/g.1073 Transcript_1006/m.1073 type:complete len:394 (+) Transcript_1006:206-1387(+)|eukprot:CAMPEP_0184017916 /NCGR_PEP_ID=MMETSP0954-20121128/7826_1 /TAXON_ID=627963 /ORGANISM="Aplanochytrium sp, Strain PBS07" /LENGTH=393 /DNA_ID=CAMNT_0026299253 /DNA_START=173 /DNA_END=1354 /DNA_ORIENTATION=-
MEAVPLKAEEYDPSVAKKQAYAPTDNRGLVKKILIVLVLFFTGFFIARTFSNWEAEEEGLVEENTDESNFEVLDDALESLEDLKDVVLDMKQTINARLAMSIQKTGTTAAEWIVQAIFKNFAEEVAEGKKKFNMYPSVPDVVNKDKYHEIRWKGKHVAFDVHGKHDNSKVSPNIPVRVKVAASQCVKHNIPAYTNECAKYIGGLRHFTNHSNFRHNKRDKYFTTFRNPISTIISWLYYESPNHNKETLSQALLETDRCAKAAASMSLLHRMITEILPGLGYQFYPLYFDEMRLYPHDFVRKLAAQLDLDVNDNVVRRVVEQTSPEYMKSVQDDLKHSSERYSGLSRKGKNSRKVRKADVKGYLNELTPEALAKCVADAKFHLSPVLKERYGFV